MNSHFQRYLRTCSGVFEVQSPLQTLENIQYHQKLIQNDHSNIREEYSNDLRCLTDPISRLSQKSRFRGGGKNENSQIMVRKDLNRFWLSKQLPTDIRLEQLVYLQEQLNQKEQELLALGDIQGLMLDLRN